MVEENGNGAVKLTVMILGGIFAFAFISISCCCGGSYFGSGLAVDYGLSYVLEDQPMEITPAASVDISGPELYARIETEAGSGGTVVFTSPELNGAIQDTMTDGESALEITGDIVRFDAAIPIPDDERYLNLHLVGRGLMTRGLFQDFYMDEAKVGQLDLSILQGENMAMNINQQLMKTRADEPELGLWLDAVERAEVLDGSLHLTIGPGGIPK